MVHYDKKDCCCGICYYNHYGYCTAKNKYVNDNTLAINCWLYTNGITLQHN